MDSNSKSRAAKNIVITGTAQAWRFVTGFLLTVVTTRLLAPSDFGILAMAATATALITLVKDLGISQAIVQRDTISPGQINSLFWVSIAASILFALLLGASAPLIARFYAEPKVELLTIAFAALVLIGGPQAVPTAILNRNSRFNRLAIVDVASATTALAVGIGGVLLWQSYWALYVSAAAATIVSGFGIWLASGYRPGLPRFDAHTAQMLRFGSHISGFNLVNYLSRNCDTILIGRFQGIDQLGLYNRAYRLLLFPITQIHGPMGQVLVPLLSRLHADPNRYRSTYAEAVSLIMIIAQPGDLIRYYLCSAGFRTVAWQAMDCGRADFSMAGYRGSASGDDVNGGVAFPEPGARQRLLQTGFIWGFGYRHLVCHRAPLGSRRRRCFIYDCELCRSFTANMGQRRATRSNKFRGLSQAYNPTRGSRSRCRRYSRDCAAQSTVHRTRSNDGARRACLFDISLRHFTV